MTAYEHVLRKPYLDNRIVLRKFSLLAMNYTTITISHSYGLLLESK